MRIIEETQLDFSDLLISPKRSTLNSRSEVSLLRTFNWTGLDGKTTNTLECIPIMASNMATTGTPEMARILTKRGFMCCLEKHIPIQEICDLYLELERAGVQSEKSNPLEYTQRLVPSIGIKESLDGFKQLAKEHKVTCVCVDVPNGYIPNFMTRVKDVVKLFPNALVFAGNVVTGDICQDLVFNHALCSKVGIGNGCFLGNMKVLTKDGLKKIQDIEEGDLVLTHTGNFEKVVNKFTYNTHKQIIDINGIKCTPNHKFYVAKVEDLPKITEDNYKDYCVWIEAQELDNSKHRLVKIRPYHSQPQLLS